MPRYRYGIKAGFFCVHDVPRGFVLEKGKITAKKSGVEMLVNGGGIYLRYGIGYRGLVVYRPLKGSAYGHRHKRGTFGGHLSFEVFGIHLSHFKSVDYPRLYILYVAYLLERVVGFFRHIQDWFAAAFGL